MLNLRFIYYSLQGLTAYFFASYRFQQQAWWFKKALYLLLLLKCFYWLLYFSFFFGADSIVYYSPVSIGLFRQPAFVFYNARLPWLNASGIILVAMISVWFLFRKTSVAVLDLLLWWLTLNLHNVIYPTLSGGDHLLNQFLFFGCFLSRDFTVGPGMAAQLRVAAHNFASLAVIMQVCVAYFIAGLAKLNSPAWLSGEAIYTISEVRHFGLFSFPSNGRAGLALSRVASYLVLGYQLLFPLLAFLPRIKKPFLVAGLLMHLYIAVVMGLPMFACIMASGYIYFWPFKGR